MNGKRWLYKTTMPHGDFVFVELSVHTGDSLYMQNRDGTEGQKLLYVYYDRLNSPRY